jgi:putative ABC transport system ATP-binding protein
MTPALSLTAVTKYFHRRTPNQVIALNAVSIDVPQGQFVAIIGSNGAGKSTLIKTISGLSPPDEGTVRFEGVDITRQPVHRRARVVGRIAQDPQDSTCAVMTIEENLAMAERRGKSRGLGIAVTEAGKARYRQILAPLGLGLESRLAVRVGTLSGGQRQALALLMATISGSRLLLLDEHLAALDPKTAASVMDLTARLVSEQRLTTFMITHNMNDAIRWGDRLLLMHAGRIVLDVSGPDKAALTTSALIDKFHEVSQGELVEDRILLTR